MDPVWALGCMSGTSLDGVDAAMVRTDGVRIMEFGASAYRAYSQDERRVLHAALGAWPGADGVEEAAAIVEAAHAELIAQFDGVDVVGFHGQTLAHEPQGRGTHQAGSGIRLAQITGRDVVWDFRTADVTLGGQGAPLAPAYHFACAQRIAAREPVVFLNLGGVGNLTWVDPHADGPEAPGAMLAFDTGPANAPLDDIMGDRLGMARDEGGVRAMAGQADADAVAAVLARKFYTVMPPKSLDRNDFHDVLALVADMGTEDALATLVEICAASVAQGLTFCAQRPARVLVCGGGRHNPAIMARLAALCPCDVAPVEAVGLDGDMLEAQAFAYLAVRVARGLPTSFPHTTGVAGNVGGGQIARAGPSA